MRQEDLEIAPTPISVWVSPQTKIMDTNSNTLFSCVKCGFTATVTDSKPVVSAKILESLSNSNSPPSPKELATLTGEYNAVSRALPSIDTEINLLEVKLEALKNKRREFASSLGVYKFALNPCRRLPNEILASIFDLCMEEDRYVARMAEDPRALLVYSDGSLMKKGGFPAVGAGVALYHKGQEIEYRMLGLGRRAEVYDAEMAALSMGAKVALSANPYSVSGLSLVNTMPISFTRTCAPSWTRERRTTSL
ncbi:hypothetical protein L218DRAFT_581649 [Marasmius fiardii PR-910]|nr:hypothetical protein L218DRAFT_581649 [Marasmius fiardii PR-910]